MLGVREERARATQAETLLGAPSLEHLHVLDGGITAWEHAGGALNRGRQTWELERQVRLVAGSIVLAGVLASTVAPWAKWISAAIGAGLAGLSARVAAEVPVPVLCSVEAGVRMLLAVVGLGAAKAPVGSLAAPSPVVTVGLSASLAALMAGERRP